MEEPRAAACAGPGEVVDGDRVHGESQPGAPFAVSMSSTRWNAAVLTTHAGRMGGEDPLDGLGIGDVEVGAA